MRFKLSKVFLVVSMALLVLALVACSQPAAPASTSAPAATTKPATSAAAATSVAATTAPASTAAAPANVIKLKWAAYQAPTTVESKNTIELANLIQTRSNGRVQITFIGGGSLLDVTNMYDGVVNGVADIGTNNVDSTAGKFPELMITELPMSAPSAWVMTHADNEYVAKYPLKELSKTHIMLMWGNGPAFLLTTKPVNTLQDLKSMKIRGTGECGQVLKGLGGTPQALPMGEMYDALSKGVLDGILVDPSVLSSYKLGDVVKYITDCSQVVGNCMTFFVSMNLNTWNSLPPDIQDIINKACAEYVEKTAVVINDEDIEGLNYAAKAGAKTITLSATDAASWKAASAAITAAYIPQLKAAGLTSDETNLKYLQDRVNYWNDLQVKQGIPFPINK